MDNRWCNRCQQEKPLDEFPRARGKRLGRGYTCKSCERIAHRISDPIRNRTPEHIEKEKIRWSSERVLAWNRERYHRNKEQNKAKAMIRKLIDMGVMKRCPCVSCGEIKSQGHHPDYSKPLEVVWLCQKHHSEIHKEYRDATIPEEERRYGFVGYTTQGSNNYPGSNRGGVYDSRKYNT